MDKYTVLENTYVDLLQGKSLSFKAKVQQCDDDMGAEQKTELAQLIEKEEKLRSH